MIQSIDNSNRCCQCLKKMIKYVLHGITLYNNNEKVENIIAT